MRVIQRHGQRTTHQSVAAQRAVKARQAAHFEDLPYPFALFPSSQPEASRNSTSLLALERFPSLSLRRSSRTALRCPSGKSAAQKQDNPPFACASTRCASLCGTEKTIYGPPAGSCRRCIFPLWWCCSARPSRPVFPSSPYRSAGHVLRARRQMRIVAIAEQRRQPVVK